MTDRVHLLGDVFEEFEHNSSRLNGQKHIAAHLQSLSHCDHQLVHADLQIQQQLRFEAPLQQMTWHVLEKPK